MTCQVLRRSNFPDIAYDAQIFDITRPTFLFLPGYRSDMTGSKATALAAWAVAGRHNFVRFDYTGHGASGGVFRDLLLSNWFSDTFSVIGHVIPAESPLILIGSSMGGWLALCAALNHPEHVKGIIGIAAAPDFTDDMHRRMTMQQRETLERTGLLEMPSDHGPDPYIITKRFIEDGAHMRVLDKPHDLDIPMTLFQGGKDPSVPAHTPELITKVFPRAQIKTVLIDDGDHALSRPQDLAQICTAAQEMSDLIGDGGR